MPVPSPDAKGGGLCAGLAPRSRRTPQNKSQNKQHILVIETGTIDIWLDWLPGPRQSRTRMKRIVRLTGGVGAKKSAPNRNRWKLSWRPYMFHWGRRAMNKYFEQLLTWFFQKLDSYNLKEIPPPAGNTPPSLTTRHTVVLSTTPGPFSDIIVHY